MRIAPMNPLRTAALAGCAALLVAGLVLLAPTGRDATAIAADSEPETAAQADSSHEELELLRVPPSEDYYPCTDCHEPGEEVNRTPRELTEEHEDIKLEHGGGRLWCLDCHSAENRDYLHTAGGKPIPFENAHELCGQCHFHRYRDWTMNVHGKRVGEWNGKKQVYVCFKCHDQHAPKFKPLEPKPRPLRPDEIR